MTIAITLSGTAQAIGYAVLLVAVLLVAGYVWYRVVTFPRFRRRAHKEGRVIVGEDLAFGDDLYVPWVEADWRPLGFLEWVRRAGEVAE